jgi:2-amino-4-hydroxy-6-hydroxymethyldihydropteridine diphosphokinase/dihydropteroate synthase
MLKHLRYDQHRKQHSELNSLIATRTPLCDALPNLVPDDKTKKTHIMSILNLTPDSFSDGGRHAVNDQEYLRKTITSHLQGGATIIDLGAQSSRPGAPDITEEEELERLTPALEILASLRQDPSTPPFSISVDTYRATVAEAAVKAGADIVNDISAGLLDPNMLPTVARLGCTYIMMHMRGTPHTMSSKKNTTYNRSIPAAINQELLARVIAAEAAGIRRWRMILDPGIGFAKTADQNLEILRRFPRFANRTDTNPSVNAPGRVVDGAYRSLAGIPWLAGSSRKGFIGKITGVKEASERTWGTAATVTAAVRGGADIVRVHDVAEMAQVVRMSEAIYRPQRSGTAVEG